MAGMMDALPDVTEADQKIINSYVREKCHVMNWSDEVATLKRNLQDIEEAENEIILCEMEDDLEDENSKIRHPYFPGVGEECMLFLDTETIQNRLSSKKAEALEKLREAEAKLSKLKTQTQLHKDKLAKKFKEMKFDHDDE